MKTMDFFFRKKVIPLLELPMPAGPLKGQSYLKEQGLEPTDLTKIQHKMFEVLYDATLEPLYGEAHFAAAIEKFGNLDSKDAPKGKGRAESKTKEDNDRDLQNFAIMVTAIELVYSSK